MKLFLMGVALLNCLLSVSQPKEEEIHIWGKQALIDSLVRTEMNRQHIFGLSLGIVENGKLIMMKGYGLANIEQNIPASTETVYKIGSVSKQMVAAAILLLVQEDKLKLTDSLPRFFKGAPESWSKITVRQLLNHTSGLPRDAPALDNMKEQQDSIVIQSAYNSKLLFQPGTKWRYCNLGYFMLADIIRQLSGQSFPNFMQQEIFRKLGLLSTRTTSASAIVKNRANGYVYKSKDSIYNAKNYIALRPSGAFLSSVSDLVKWEMVMQNQQLLSKENWNKMWTHTVRTGETNQYPVEYYGYGWDVGRYDNISMVHHDGSLPGFSSSYFRFVENKTAIIILTNADDAYPKTIALAIGDILLRQAKDKNLIEKKGVIP